MLSAQIRRVQALSVNSTRAKNNKEGTAMKKKFTILIAFLLVMGFGTSAQATIVTYTDHTSFLNAISTTKLTENFDDATLIPGLSITEVGGGGTIANGVYENIVDKDVNLPDGRYQVFNYASMFAFGAFLDLAGPGGPGSSIDMYVNDTNTFVMNVPNTAAGQFYGFISSVPFTGVRFQEGPGSAQETYDAIDITLAPVPEPLTMLLLGFGLVGLAGLRRFK
jgi:hypothetical protein